MTNKFRVPKFAPILYVRYNVHMKNIITATHARANFFKVIEAAKRPGKSITITVEGEPRVIIMSVEDFEGWQETLEIMADNKLSASIEKEMRDIKKGKGKFYTEKEVWEKLKL